MSEYALRDKRHMREKGGGGAPFRAYRAFRAGASIPHYPFPRIPPVRRGPSAGLGEACESFRGVPAGKREAGYLPGACLWTADPRLSASSGRISMRKSAHPRTSNLPAGRGAPALIREG